MIPAPTSPPFYEEGSANFKNIWRKVPDDQPLDYFCWDLYARFQNDVEKDSSLVGKREEVTHQIEGGTHRVASFAKDLASRIVHAHLETVAQLSIFYDLLNWESDIIHQGFWEATFELLKERGTIRLETEGPNEGCWVVPFGGLVETEEGVKSLDKILVRSNRTVTYTGKDVAYQLWKFGLLGKDFLYKAWGLQTSGEVLWTTAERAFARFRPQSAASGLPQPPTASGLPQQAATYLVSKVTTPSQSGGGGSWRQWAMRSW